MELEIVSGGIAENEERENHQEGNCDHDKQRQREDGSTDEIDALFLLRVHSLSHGRVRQGTSLSN